MLSFKQFLEEKDGPCWKGYEMVGMKKKGKRKVPNCVPIKEATYQGGTGTPGSTKGTTAETYSINQSKANHQATKLS